MKSSASCVRQPTPSRARFSEPMPEGVGERARARIGIIVNPLAGIGGAVALRGSDGAETVALARARGAKAQSPARAARALRALAASMAPASVTIMAAPGPMGATAARQAGFDVTPTSTECTEITTAQDTRAAAAVMLDAGVELLLFAGGDGTARDIVDVVGQQLPVLGIPAGVKMHSGVFAPSPEAAARAGEAVLRTDPGKLRLRSADVADVDEQALREGRVSSILYGSASVPDLPRTVLPAKAASRPNPGSELELLSRAIAQQMDPDSLYLIGPGSTTAGVMNAVGLDGTLLGVDAVRDNELVGRDLTEDQILELLDHNDRSKLIVGLVGGQGMLFGRGNRQLSTDVLRRITKDAGLATDRITILAAADKLLKLAPPTLWVDTGDPVLDSEYCGYVRVHVGPREQIVMKVSC
jgi:predicted polyphosphate/ATP-dependent NAD kinase